MDNRLFLLTSEGTAEEMSEKQYEDEATLQQIIEDNPHLLARAWSDKPCRLFPIQREYVVPDPGDTGNVYWLDHLFVAEDAVPVLVEVKRSSDTRIRREVVGQMMDYACGVSSWSAEKLRGLFREASSEGVKSEFDTDDFWKQVATNLKAERLRLVFAADQIPDTLRVLIEFLDRNMEGIEVYGVEVKRYIASGAVLLTSNIIGNSLAQDTTPQTWDDDGFRAFLQSRSLGSLFPTAMALKRYAASLGMSCPYLRGGPPCFSARIKGQGLFTLSVWSKKSIGNMCLLGFDITHLLTLLGASWSDQRVRETLTDFPGKPDAFAREYAWNTPHFLYMDLRSLSDDRDLEAFKGNLKTMYEAVVSSQMEEITPSIQ